MSKMFKDTVTDNPYHGCTYNCVTCWARELALKFQRQGVKGYENGFKPTFNPLKLNRPPKKAKNLFICGMGDLFCPGSELNWILSIMDWCHNSDLKQDFMFLTKNPRRYLEVLRYRPVFKYEDRFIFGATIETNRNSPFSPWAPDPSERAKALWDFYYVYPDIRTFLSIEPIMDFDLDIMRQAIELIHPERVYIGYDNYKNWGELEPSMKKVLELIETTKGPEWIKKTMR